MPHQSTKHESFSEKTTVWLPTFQLVFNDEKFFECWHMNHRIFTEFQITWKIHCYSPIISVKIILFCAT